MKKIFVLFGALFFSSIVNAQIARWLIPNQYESIHLDQGANVIVTDSSGYKIIWSYNGTRLATTEDDLYPYQDHMSVSVKRNTNRITGFYNSVGRYVKIEQCEVAHSYPYFSDGHLLVSDGEFYRFVYKEGFIDESKYVKAYPFLNGYSSCYTYQNFVKQKSPYYMLLNKDMEIMKFSYNGKDFDADDINFISSVNDENIGIVVIKRKAYFFNGKDRAISPIFANPEETNIKNQGKIDGELAENLYTESDTLSVLRLKSGKKDHILIQFDKLLRPIAIKCNDKELVYKRKNVTCPEIPTPLIDMENEGLFGINWGKIEVFPPQFTKIGKMFENKAFVCLSGKYGMLEILKDKHFEITINKGNDIPFRHQNLL